MGAALVAAGGERTRDRLPLLRVGRAGERTHVGFREGVVDEVQLSQKLQKMFAGEIINTTEKRKVMHFKLRT